MEVPSLALGICEVQLCFFDVKEKRNYVHQDNSISLVLLHNNVLSGSIHFCMMPCS